MVRSWLPPNQPTNQPTHWFTHPNKTETKAKHKPLINDNKKEIFWVNENSTHGRFSDICSLLRRHIYPGFFLWGPWTTTVVHMSPAALKSTLHSIKLCAQSLLGNNFIFWSDSQRHCFYADFTNPSQCYSGDAVWALENQQRPSWYPCLCKKLHPGESM